VAVLGFLEYAAGRTVKPIEVLLAGPAPIKSTAAFVRGLGAPVHWGVRNSEIRFPPGTLDIPIRCADPTVCAVVQRLGFSSRSSLDHATQRWMGKRPGELRVKVKAPARTRK
jgi:hypothetical protein